MPYRLATPQYSVNGVNYSTVYGKKQAILMRFAKIEKVLVHKKVTKKLPNVKPRIHLPARHIFLNFFDF